MKRHYTISLEVEDAAIDALILEGETRGEALARELVALLEYEHGSTSSVVLRTEESVVLVEDAR